MAGKTTNCPRCGAEIPGDLELSARATRGHVLVRDRKLVVPDKALADLRSVAAALRCRAGLCGPREVP